MSLQLPSPAQLTPSRSISAMIAAIVKTVQTRVLATSNGDPTIATVAYDRWLFIETYLVIITASVPCIRSLLRSINGRSKHGRYTHELNSRCAKHALRMRRCESWMDGKDIMNVSEDERLATQVCHGSPEWALSG